MRMSYRRAEKPADDSGHYVRTWARRERRSLRPPASLRIIRAPPIDVAISAAGPRSTMSARAARRGTACAKSPHRIHLVWADHGGLGGASAWARPRGSRDPRPPVQPLAPRRASVSKRCLARKSPAPFRLSALSSVRPCSRESPAASDHRGGPPKAHVHAQTATAAPRPSRIHFFLCPPQGEPLVGSYVTPAPPRNAPSGLPPTCAPPRPDDGARDPRHAVEVLDRSSFLRIHHVDGHLTTVFKRIAQKAAQDDSGLDAVKPRRGGWGPIRKVSSTGVPSQPQRGCPRRRRPAKNFEGKKFGKIPFGRTDFFFFRCPRRTIPRPRPQQHGRRGVRVANPFEPPSGPTLPVLTIGVPPREATRKLPIQAPLRAGPGCRAPAPCRDFLAHAKRRDPKPRPGPSERWPNRADSIVDTNPREQNLREISGIPLASLIENRPPPRWKAAGGSVGRKMDASL